VIILFVANNRKIMQGFPNRWLLNTLGIIATLIMGGTGLWLLAAWIIARL
jgi:Mn2+/Fe2+ NRAMP family transporter